MTTIDVDGIRKLADGLAKATDEMNEGIEQAERALISTRLGVSADVPLPGARGTLTFRKTEQGWGLFVDRGSAGLTPLRKSPRDTRIVACEFLHTLLAAMLQRAEAEEHRAQLASGGFTAFAASTRVDGDDRADVEREETLGPGQVRVTIDVVLEGEDAALDGLRVVDDALDAGDLQSAVESLVEDRELELSIVSVTCR